MIQKISNELRSSSRLPPLPGRGHVCDPVARALEAVGGRRTLVLVRHLLAGPKGFQELRDLTGIAPPLLSTRLRQLSAEGFVASRREGNRSLYTLTDRGRSLEPIVAALVRWWFHHGIPDLERDAEVAAPSPSAGAEMATSRPDF